MNARKEKKSKASPGYVYRKKLGRVLKFHRELLGYTRKHIQSELLKSLNLKKYKADVNWVQFRSIVDPFLGGSLTELEDRGLADEAVYLPDIQLLTKAYHIPELMIDSARSRPLKSMISVTGTSDLLEVSQEGVPYYGYQAKYAVPKTQLDGTENVAIVHLELYENGHSDSHQHPGEEILYLESGSIEMRFEGPGIYSRLEAGSFVHFDSHQMHSAWNLRTQTARCFIIRFYKPELETSIKVKGRARAKRLPTTPTGTTRRGKRSARLVTTQQYLDEPLEVPDRFSFGSFLQLLCSESVRGSGRGRLSLTDLSNRAKKRGYPFSRSKLDRIHRGETRVLKNELRELAEIYEIEPMVLYNFLLQSFQPTIMVHGEGDMDEVREKLPKGVTYRIPRRRLAFSDMTIALLTLDPGAMTNLNHHPGLELIKPLTGELAIEFGGLQTVVKEGQFAHFYSHFNHRAVNVSSAPTTMLSVRFIRQ